MKVKNHMTSGAVALSTTLNVSKSAAWRHHEKWLCRDHNWHS